MGRVGVVRVGGRGCGREVLLSYFESCSVGDGEGRGIEKEGKGEEGEVGALEMHDFYLLTRGVREESGCVVWWRVGILAEVVTRLINVEGVRNVSFERS